MPTKVIMDEEFLLSQTSQKLKLQGHLNQKVTDDSQKQIQSDKVQRWFNAEYFYS